MSIGSEDLSERILRVFDDQPQAKRIWVFADGRQAEARIVAWYGPVPSLKAWFLAGEDIHTNVARLIARFVQAEKIHLPRDLFGTKSWNEYGEGDDERQIAKTTVHGNNYGMGPEQYAFVVKLPEAYARIVQDIYFTLFPEIKTGYQARINEALVNGRTLQNPYGRVRIFYGRLDDVMRRAAYAWYASSTVGDWLSLIWTGLCELGWSVPLQQHDGLGVAIEEDRAREVVNDIIRLAAEPFTIHGEEVTIPIDLKIGPTWGDLKKWDVSAMTGSPSI